MHRIVAAAAVLMAAGTPALAQAPGSRPVVSPAPVPVERLPPVIQMEAIALELAPGTQGIVTLSGPYSQVILGNVEIADALPKSDTVVVVQGKKAGVTDMLIMRQDKLIQRVNITVGSSRPGNRIYTHSPSLDVHEYTTYECNPVCIRVFDPLARRSAGSSVAPGQPGIAVGQPGQPSPGGSINVILPPPPPAQ